MKTVNLKKKPAGTSPRILAFEEDKSNQYLLNKLLTKNGYVAEVVDKASEVLARLTEQDQAYDLIIINVCSPIKDDLDLVRTIRLLPDQRASSIPILATTTAMHPNIKDKCQSEGAVEVIVKPFDIGEFCTLVKQCIHCQQKSQINNEV